MSAAHAKYCYSATLQTDDHAVLHCLRGLCQRSAGGSFPQIGWGGTTQAQWKAQRGKFVVRLTTPAKREEFIEEAKRLLAGHWSEVGRSDNDPATPQR
jgi:hypothetical protein